MNLADVVSLSVSGDVTTLRVKPKHYLAPFSAGSYAFVSIPSIGLGWHPFSIASDPSETTLTFHIKSMGVKTWTGKLLELAKLEGPAPNNEDIGLVNDKSTSHNVPLYLYGPYGSLNVPLESSSIIVMFAGGIGITPFLSVFSDLISKKEKKKLPNLRKASLIWITKVSTDAVGEDLRILRNKCMSFSEFEVKVFDNGRPDVAFELEKAVYGCTVDNNVTKYQHIPARSHNTTKSIAVVEVDSNEQIGQAYLHKKDVSVLVCGPSSLTAAVESVAKDKYYFHKESFLF